MLVKKTFSKDVSFILEEMLVEASGLELGHIFEICGVKWRLLGSHEAEFFVIFVSVWINSRD